MEYRIIEGSYGHLTFELKITNIQESDYGTYVCYAQNIIGSMTRQVELYGKYILLVTKNVARVEQLMKGDAVHASTIRVRCNIHMYF